MFALYNPLSFNIEYQKNTNSYNKEGIEKFGVNSKGCKIFDGDSNKMTLNNSVIESLTKIWLINNKTID